MFLEKIKSEGIAQLSYIVGNGSEAAVIDPRRDYQIYLDTAVAQGMRITRIFETHRNEDYVVGSQDLARKTGATIHHGSKLDFAYGEKVREGDSFILGDLKLEILLTPGHTDEYTEARLAGSTHIFLGELPDRLDELDRAKPVITFCGSGKRAIIAMLLYHL